MAGLVQLANESGVSMRFESAMQAWHDAFKDDVSAVDATDVSGVQFTARGADNKIIDHCEKGKVQAAVGALRKKDPLAAAWGMFAYAPEGKCDGVDRVMIFSWLVGEYAIWGESTKFKEYPEIKIKLLARMAMHSVAGADRGGADSRSDVALLMNLVQCETRKEWEKDWKPVWRKLRDFCKKLPGRALTPIEMVVAEYRHRENIERMSA